MHFSTIKSCLYGIILSLITSAQASEPVIDALYARIEGINGKSVKVYRGAFHVKPLSLYQRYKFLFKKPTITFFDFRNNKVHQENLLFDTIVHGVKDRLTVLPRVHYVDVVTVSALGGGGLEHPIPLQQRIEMFDRRGKCVVRTANTHSGLHKDMPLPSAVINECAKLVSNPAVLKTLKIRHEIDQAGYKTT